MKRRIQLSVAVAAMALALFVPASAGAAIKIVTTTEDLAALAKEVGGDKVTVDALGKGYQDPHFVEPKPSFILKLHNADLLILVGRELEIGWLPPLITQSRNPKIQPSANGYLDASLNVKILDMPTGQITRARATSTRRAIRTTGWIPTTAARSRKRSSRSCRSSRLRMRPTSGSGTRTSTSGSRTPRSAGTRRWRRSRAPRW